MTTTYVPRPFPADEIDPRFPGSRLPTPEALVRRAKEAGWRFDRNVDWLDSPHACGCAAGVAGFLQDGNIRLGWSVLAGSLGLASSYCLSGIVVGFEGDEASLLRRDHEYHVGFAWGREVARLAGLPETEDASA